MCPCYRLDDGVTPSPEESLRSSTTPVSSARANSDLKVEAGPGPARSAIVAGEDQVMPPYATKVPVCRGRRCVADSRETRCADRKRWRNALEEYRGGEKTERMGGIDQVLSELVENT